MLGRARTSVFQGPIFSIQLPYRVRAQDVTNLGSNPRVGWVRAPTSSPQGKISPHQARPATMRGPGRIRARESADLHPFNYYIQRAHRAESVGARLPSRPPGLQAAPPPRAPEPKRFPRRSRRGTGRPGFELYISTRSFRGAEDHPRRPLQLLGFGRPVADRLSARSVSVGGGLC